jgi:flagellar hook-associated protein 1 FlgK
MGSSILNIGLTGLYAAQAGLLTTSHNIANAGTRGFNRQQILQSTNAPQFFGGGFFGQGTDVTSVRRIYDRFLAGQVGAASSQAAQYQTYSNQISQIANLLADSSAGLSPALQDFFGSINAVAADPASLSSRQAMLSGAQSLVARFHSLDARLTEIRDGVNTQITSSVAGINAAAQQIAALNDRIAVVQATGSGQPPNDLLDQRDQLVADLNSLVRVTTSTESDGSISVFIGSGQALVVGAQASSLTAKPAADDLTRIEIGLQGPGGGAIPLPEGLLTGGTLGGLIAFRRETLDPAINNLGRIAIGLAQTFNAQHRLGQDLNGELGGDMFQVASASVVANARNSGTANLAATLGNAADLTGSDYRVSYDGSNYTLTRLSDNRSWTASSLARLPPSSEPQGFSLDVASGVPAAGDSFLIQPTRKGSADLRLLITDPRDIAAAAPMLTAASVGNTGTGTISAGAVQSTANLGVLPVTLTYASGNLSGFPPGLDVTIVHNGEATTHTAPVASIAYSPGDTIQFGGMSFGISGQPNDGDTFAIARNSSGVSDNRNALLLGQLQTANTLLGGSASYQSAYAQMVGVVGNKAREVDLGLNAQQSLVRQAQDAQQSVSGVNLDEEAANLVHYQQMYQASGKVIEIASKLFDQILALAQ